MSIKKTGWLICSLLSMSDLIYAVSLPKYTQGQWLISGDVGAIWPEINTTMWVNNGSGFPTSGNFDQYSANSDHEEVMLAAAAGYRWTQHLQPWLPAVELALRYQYLFPQNITGSVTEYSLPNYQNYTYNWKANANVISAYTKLDLMQYQRAMVYFDLGLGAAFVHAYNYQETALAGVNARVSPAFADRTTTQFSYNVGAGVDVSLYPELIFSVGYEYQSFGGIESGSGQDTWSADQLSIGRFGFNTVLISLTYLFDKPRLSR